jgi:hypothetical protein
MPTPLTREGAVDTSMRAQINANFAAPASATVPATATAAGVAGAIAYDSGFLYVCTATNTWMRVAIATW